MSRSKLNRNKRIQERNIRRDVFRKEAEERERVNQEDPEVRKQKWFAELKSKSVNVKGIDTNVKYYCAYHKSWCMPRYISEEEDFVVFYSNPGWIGNWYWMTSIENFKKYFRREPVGDVGEHVPNIEYVDVQLGFDHPRVSINKTWK